MDLLISGPEARSQRVSLSTKPLSLGRSDDNELAYPDDPWLSRYHLRFEVERGDWIVRDCGSRNGTLINATALKAPHRLQLGDSIQAGNLRIQVISPEHDSSEMVAFVRGEGSAILREGAVMTSLDEVLSHTVPPPGKEDDSLSSSRAARALLRAGRELAGHRPLHELFNLILELALSAVDAKRGVILTLDDGNRLTVRASRGQEFTISTAVRDRVLNDRQSLMIEDAQLDRALKSQHSIVAQKVRSILAVPLQTGTEVLGIVYIDNGNIVAPFHQNDLELLTVLANVAAIRIEHARLAEIEKREQLTAFELAQAKEIQMGLLPERAPLFLGSEVAGFNLPCRAVGGDYYDFLPYQDGRFGLVIGDVSGKGMPAALMMSSLQARVQMLAESQPDPASALAILNRNQCERCPPGKFITLFYGLFDPADGVLYYGNAGHNYPLLLRSSGEVESLSASDMVLGIKPDSPFSLHQIRLDPGDVLGMYSDGVTEARDASGHEFGEEGLASFMRSNRDKSAAEMAKALHQRVRAWTEAESFADDFTVVFLKKH